MNETSARKIEQNKTVEQKNAEWGYTFSHMATCMSCDFLTPYISAWAQGKQTGNFNWREHLGGELLGDIAAVPATIVVQRFAPELMAGIRKTLEPVMRPFYEKIALTEAESWAHQNRIDENSNAFEEFRAQQYEYNMSKIPLQATWTLLSAALNVTVQKAPIFSEFIHNDGSTLEVLKAVSIGAGITLALQTAGRGIAPRQMHDLDDFIAEKIVQPTTNIFGGAQSNKQQKLATEVSYLGQ